MKRLTANTIRTRSFHWSHPRYSRAKCRKWMLRLRNSSKKTPRQFNTTKSGGFIRSNKISSSNLATLTFLLSKLSLVFASSSRTRSPSASTMLLCWILRCRRLGRKQRKSSGLSLTTTSKIKWRVNQMLRVSTLASLTKKMNCIL